MNISCRLLRHRASGGPWNMAVDEVLTERTALAGTSCFRIYTWVPPTLSLGYFQRYEDREHHRPSADCPVVRRPSGGGAIVHDREITYSFAVPRSCRLAGNVARLYEQVHLAVADALRCWQVQAELWRPDMPGRQYSAQQRDDEVGGCGAGWRADSRSAFLCFQRRACGDLVIGKVKVAGSAQRRSAGAVLQHGSILLARSAAAPELPGVCDVTGRAIDEEQFAEALLEAVARRLGLSWQPAELSAAEQARATQLVVEKYAHQRWTIQRRRTGGL